jgi:glucokinase
MHTPVVLGLDFGGTKIAAAVCDAAGSRLGGTTIDTRPDDGAKASLARGLDAARTLLERIAPGREVAAVGASTFGIPREEGIALAPAVSGWGELALGRELSAAFAGAQIRVATDVKAAAQVEAESGALRGCDPGIYLNLGTGLAVAIVVGGTVVHGRNGAAGEIGYNLRSVGDVGRPLPERVPLEDMVSGRALLRVAPDAATVFAAAASDPAMAALLADFTAELAFHLVNLAIAIDAVRIAVGGGMVRSWHLLNGTLRAALDAAVPYPPELVVASYPYDAPLLGALALAMAATRDPAPTTSVKEGLSG